MLAERNQAGTGIRVKVLLSEPFGPAGFSAALAFLGEVEAGAEDLERLPVVQAAGDDSAEDG